MAITDVRQLRSFRFSEQQSDDGTITYTGSVDLLVISDTKDPSFAAIKSDTNTWPGFFNRKIPQIGDTEPMGDISLNVISRDFQYYKDNDRAVVISVRYEYKPEEQDQPDPQQPEFFRKFAFQTVQTTQPACESNEDDPDNKKPVKNSANDPVDGLTEECALIRGTYTNGRVVSPNFATLWTYINKINQVEFLGAAKWTVRCTGIGADYNEKSQVWSVSVEFTYKPDTWQIRYYDVGYNEIVGGERRAILDKSGNPVSKPVALNNNGTAKAVGQEPDVLKILPYEQVDLNGMFAACNI